MTALPLRQVECDSFVTRLSHVEASVKRLHEGSVCPRLKTARDANRRRLLSPEQAQLCARAAAAAFSAPCGFTRQQSIYVPVYSSLSHLSADFVMKCFDEMISAAI